MGELRQRAYITTQPSALRDKLTNWTDSLRSLEEQSQHPRTVSQELKDQTRVPYKGSKERRLVGTVSSATRPCRWR